MALVGNAADPEQVAAAKEKQIKEADLELADLRAILQLEAGRRVMWRFLAHCGVHESIWEPSAKIHYNAGRQDVGHYIEAKIVRASEEFYELMQREARGRKRKEGGK